MSDPTDSTESGEPTEAVDEAAGDDTAAPAKKSAAKKSTAKKSTASTPAKKAAKGAAAASTKVAEKKPGKNDSKGATKKSAASKAESGKAARGEGPRTRRLRRKSKDDPFLELDPVAGPVLTVRSVLSLVLVVAGIAWMAYYYIGVRPDPTKFPVPKPTGWGVMGDLGNWNYLIGFGLIMLGLIVAAHRSTPLGRGRGVVVGMLACFLIGLVWICTFYVISGADYFYKVPVFNDLEQKNLIVGIAFMALGFTYATKWE